MQRVSRFVVVVLAAGFAVFVYEFVQFAAVIRSRANVEISVLNIPKNVAKASGPISTSLHFESTNEVVVPRTKRTTLAPTIGTTISTFPPSATPTSSPSAVEPAARISAVSAAEKYAKYKNYSLSLLGTINDKRTKGHTVKKNELLIFETVRLTSKRGTPCPLGVLEKKFPTMKCGPALSTFGKGKLVVGVSANRGAFGYWLKLRPNPNFKGWTYAPIQRLGTGGGQYTYMKLKAKAPFDETVSNALKQPVPLCLLEPLNPIYDNKECSEGVEQQKMVLTLMQRLKYISRKEYNLVYNVIQKLELTVATAHFEDDTTIVHPVDVPLVPSGPIPPSITETYKNYASYFSGRLLTKAQNNCHLAEKWTVCVQRKRCVWRSGACTWTPVYPNEVFGEAWIREKYEVDVSRLMLSPERFFIYQPSGGLNNQRIMMENAMIVCRILNRTCIIPHATQHKNRWYKYNECPIDDISSQQMLFDFDKLSTVARVLTLPTNYTLLSWISEMQKRNGISFETVDRDLKRVRDRKDFYRYDEPAIMKHFGREDAKVLYFSKASMFDVFQWRGGAKYDHRRLVHRAVSYRDEFKRVVIQMAQSAGHFAAIHVRRGDYVGMDIFKDKHHEVDWYAERIDKYKAETNKIIYVASDEMYRAYFNMLRRAGWKLAFFESLPGDLVAPLLERFPRSMFDSVSGIIDQLMCSYADWFLEPHFRRFPGIYCV